MSLQEGREWLQRRTREGSGRNEADNGVSVTAARRKSYYKQTLVKALTMGVIYNKKGAI